MTAADQADVGVLRRAAQLLLDLADETDEEIKSNPYWHSELEPRERWYANGVENAIGRGPSAHLAGLLTPAAARELAAVFRSWARMGEFGPDFLGRVGGRQTVTLARLLLAAEPPEIAR